MTPPGDTRFEIATAGKIVFGAGALKEAGAMARSLGQRALIVTGRDPERARRLGDILEQQSVARWTFSIDGEPTVDQVEHGIQVARGESCDVVIAIGGGSAVDAGKAVAAMAANEGELLDYLEVIGRGRALPRAGLPCIAIPTTAGTGAEVTRNAVLASREHKVKVSLRSPFLLPRVALIDPELTFDLPPALTACTGMDALTQLIEPYVCTRANPFTDALCADGVRRVARSLAPAFENGRDARAREDMCIASLFGGLALANAGLGAVHGFAAPIGGSFDAPHGAICAALLPHVMEMNVRALRERQPGSGTLARYDQVAHWLTGNADATADDGIQWVRRLVRHLQIPALSAHGITRSHFDELVTKASAASSMKPNPVSLTPAELNTILDRAWWCERPREQV
jgi:alcohol dehydrogenase class IV